MKFDVELKSTAHERHDSCDGRDCERDGGGYEKRLEDWAVAVHAVDGLDYSSELDVDAFVGDGRFGEEWVGSRGQIEVAGVVDVVVRLLEAGAAEVWLGEFGLLGYDYCDGLVPGFA